MELIDTELPFESHLRDLAREGRVTLPRLKQLARSLVHRLSRHPSSGADYPTAKTDDVLAGTAVWGKAADGSR